MRSIVLLILCILLVQSVAIGYQFSETSRRREDLCHAVGNLDAVISQTLRRSRQNLDTLSYYKSHPREKAQQKREIDKTLRLFAPKPCS